MTGYIGIAEKNVLSLLNNGVIDNACTNWTMASVYTVSATSTANSGRVRLTVNDTVDTSTTGTIPCYTTFNTVSGSTAGTNQILYCQAFVQGGRNTFEPNSSYPRAYLSGYVNGNTNNVSDFDLTSVEGLSGDELNDRHYHKMSVRVETYDSNSNNYYDYFRMNFGLAVTNTEGDMMYIRNIFIINLTEVFGRGNEPSKSNCDNYMTVLDNKIYYQGPEVAAESVAHNISKMYIGIDGVAHRIKKAYIGVNNVARLWYKIYPTFEELFTNACIYSYRGGRSASSTAKLSINLSNTSDEGTLAAGQTWFALFSCGGSLEITKLYVDSTSSITRTQLSLTTASGETSQSTSISGTTLSSSNNIYSGVMIAFLFNYNVYPVHAVEYMFKNCWKQKLKYYYASSLSSTATSSSNTRYATASVSPPGILIPMFYSSNACVSISTCDDPLTPIRALGTTNSNVALVQQTYSSTNYFYPSKDGSAIVGVRSYTLNRLYEDWL